MPSGTFTFIPRVLAQIKEPIELYNLSKFPEDSNFSSDLETVNIVKILGGFSCRTLPIQVQCVLNFYQ